MLNHTLPMERSVILQMSKFCIITITSIYTVLFEVGGEIAFAMCRLNLSQSSSRSHIR